MATLSPEVWDGGDTFQVGHPSMKVQDENIPHSQTSFSRDEQELMSRVVRHRVGIEDKENAIKASQQELTKAEAAFTQLQVTAKAKISVAKEQLKHHQSELLAAENAFRRKILDGLLVGRLPAKEEEPEKPVEVAHQEELGRAE